MEFLKFSLEAVNLPYTFLMLLIALFWLSTFIGFLDLGSFDVDVDLEADVDLDADAEITSVGGMSKLLHFFHVGEVPIMILLSFFFLFAWVGSVLTNYYLENSSWGIAALLALPILIGSLILTKFASIPFVKVFKHISKADDTNVIGKVCILKSNSNKENVGLAEVKLDNVTQTIYVVPKTDIALTKGDKALVIMREESRNCYVVEPYQS